MHQRLMDVTSYMQEVAQKEPTEAILSLLRDLIAEAQELVTRLGQTPLPA